MLHRRQPASAEGTRKLGTALKRSLESLFGPTLHLTSSVVELTFPTAFERLHVGFYRSKITSWMAAQEEDYRCVIKIMVFLSHRHSERSGRSCALQPAEARFVFVGLIAVDELQEGGDNGDV